MASNGMKIAIVGGGLAGLAAAMKIARPCCRSVFRCAREAFSFGLRARAASTALSTRKAKAIPRGNIS